MKDVVAQAFSLKDFDGIKAIREFNDRNDFELSAWQGNFDFNAEHKVGDSREPWLDKNFFHNGQWVTSIDLNEPGHPEIFADIILDYILEGWFNRFNFENYDEQFRENSYRTWCSTPWVVDGVGGREAVHGLTRELPLQPNPVYPADGSVLVEGLPRDERPQGWGVSFFNHQTCRKYKEVFGSAKKSTFPPNFSKFSSVDGVVSFKLHFNALPGWNNYRPLSGAYTWHAHVSDKPSSNYRSIKKIPLIQIAVSFKDSRLKGTHPEADHWVMLVYAFDPNYINSVSKVSFLPQALRHMKPMGVQFGLGPGETILFGNNKTNHMRHGEFIPDGKFALLNGPADNAYSSCMGCHSSGFTVLSEAIQNEFSESQFPGRSSAWRFSFYDSDSYKFITDRYGKGFDFNLQLESASIRVNEWLKKKEDYGSQHRVREDMTNETFLNIKRSLFPLAVDKVKKLGELFCLPELDHLDKLEYNPMYSSKEKVTFLFVIKGDRLSYCNDGIPKFCLVSAIKKGASWESIYGKEMICSDSWGNI